jgi:hypothetical protein
MSVSGTLRVNCGWRTAGKVLAVTREIPGVTLAYKTEKHPNGPNVIINMSGVDEDKIREVEKLIKDIHGVGSVTVQSGRSLLHD